MDYGDRFSGWLVVLLVEKMNCEKLASTVEAYKADLEYVRKTPDLSTNMEANSYEIVCIWELGLKSERGTWTSKARRV